MSEGSIKPGEVLNPTGIQGTPELRKKRLAIKVSLLNKLDEQCDLPGYTHLTWFAAGLQTLMTRYVEGCPWAVREVHDRAFGRVPVNLDASLTMRQPDPHDGMTQEELVARAEKLIAVVKGYKPEDFDVIDVGAIPDGELTKEDASD